MKRFYFLVLLCCLTLPHLASAQRGRRPAPIAMGPTFGFKVGAAFSSLTGTDAKEAFSSGYNISAFDTRVGPVVGGLFNYRWTDAISLQIEALYAGRGFLWKRERTGGTAPERREDNVGIHSAEIPALLKLNAKIFYFEAGVVGAFVVGATSNVKRIPANGTTVNETVEFEGLNPIGIDGAIGAGIELIQGGFFGVRYLRGFSSVGTNTNSPFAGRSLESYSIQLTGGYIFNHSTRRRR